MKDRIEIQKKDQTTMLHADFTLVHAMEMTLHPATLLREQSTKNERISTMESFALSYNASTILTK